MAGIGGVAEDAGGGGDSRGLERCPIPDALGFASGSGVLDGDVGECHLRASLDRAEAHAPTFVEYHPMSPDKPGRKQDRNSD